MMAWGVRAVTALLALAAVTAAPPSVIDARYRIDDIAQGNMRFRMGSIRLTFDADIAVGGTRQPGGTYTGATRVDALPLERACNEFNKGVMFLQGAASMTCQTAQGPMTFGTIPVDDGFGGGGGGGGEHAPLGGGDTLGRRLAAKLAEKQQRRRLGSTSGTVGADGATATIGDDCGPAGCRMDSDSDTRFDTSECYDSGAPIMYALSPLPTDDPMSVLFGTMGRLDMTSSVINGNQLILGIILEFYEEEMGTMGGIVTEETIGSCTVNLTPDVNPLTGSLAVLSNADTGEVVDGVTNHAILPDPRPCNHTKMSEDVAAFVAFLDTRISTVDGMDDYDAVEARAWQVTAFSVRESIANCKSKAFSMLNSGMQDVTRVTEQCGKPRLLSPGAGGGGGNETAPGRRLQRGEDAAAIVERIEQLFPDGKQHSRFFRSAVAQVEAYAPTLPLPEWPSDASIHLRRRLQEGIGEGGGTPHTDDPSGGGGDPDGDSGGGGASRNPDWLTDPCCNWDARFLSCCTPRPLTYSRTAWTSVDDDQVNALCDAASTDVVRSTLETLAEEQNRAGGDAATDKCVALGSGGGKDALEDSMSWFRTCIEKMYDEVSCTKGGECVSGFCDEGRQKCMVPHDNPPLMASIFATCLLDPTKADSDILARVRDRLGVPPSAPASDFTAAVITTALGDSDCVGNTAWNIPGATGRWVWRAADPDCDASVDYCHYENVFVPGNRTLCLADASCNWDRWNPSMTQEKCEGDARGTEVCMECWGAGGADGNSCWAQTQWPRCIKNDYWGGDSVARCTADGYEWVDEWGWGRCEDTAAADRAACMGECPFGEDAAMSWVDEQRSNTWNRCAGTYCTNGAIATQEECDITHSYEGCSYTVNFTAGYSCPPWESGWQTQYIDEHMDLCRIPQWSWEAEYGPGSSHLCIPGGPEAYFAAHNLTVPPGVVVSATPSPTPAPYTACAVPALTTADAGATAYCLPGTATWVNETSEDGPTMMCVLQAPGVAPDTESDCSNPESVYFACVDSGFTDLASCMIAHGGNGWVAYDPYLAGSHKCASTRLTYAECDALRSVNPDIEPVGFNTRTVLRDNTWELAEAPPLPPLYSGCAFASSFADTSDPAATTWYCPPEYRRISPPPGSPADQVWCVSTAPGTYITSYESCNALYGTLDGMYVGCNDRGYNPTSDCIAAHPGWYPGAIPSNGWCISANVPHAECIAAAAEPESSIYPIYSNFVHPMVDEGLLPTPSPSLSPTPTISITPSNTPTISATSSNTPTISGTASPSPSAYVGCAYEAFSGSLGYGMCAGIDNMVLDPRDVSEQVGGTRALCIDTVAAREDCVDGVPWYAGCLDNNVPDTGYQFCRDEHDPLWAAWLPATPSSDLMCSTGHLSEADCNTLIAADVDRYSKLTTNAIPLATMPADSYSGCALQTYSDAAPAGAACPYGLLPAPPGPGSTLNWCYAPAGTPSYRTEAECQATKDGFDTSLGGQTPNSVGYAYCEIQCSNLEDGTGDPLMDVSFWVDRNAGSPGSTSAGACSRFDISLTTCNDGWPQMAPFALSPNEDGWFPVSGPVPTPTPSVTPTSSRTISVTPSISDSPSSTRSFTSSTSITSTPSTSMGASTTPTASVTPTISVTSSISLSATPSPIPYAGCAYEAFTNDDGWGECYGDSMIFDDFRANPGESNALCLLSTLTPEECVAANAYVACVDTNRVAGTCELEHDATWLDWATAPVTPGEDGCAASADAVDEAACAVLTDGSADNAAITADRIWVEDVPVAAYGGCEFILFVGQTGGCPWPLREGPHFTDGALHYCVHLQGTVGYRTQAECEAAPSPAYVGCERPCMGLASDPVEAALWRNQLNLVPFLDWTDPSNECFRYDLTEAQCDAVPGGQHVERWGISPILAPVPSPSATPTPSVSTSSVGGQRRLSHVEETMHDDVHPRGIEVTRADVQYGQWMLGDVRAFNAKINAGFEDAARQRRQLAADPQAVVERSMMVIDDVYAGMAKVRTETSPASVHTRLLESWGKDPTHRNKPAGAKAWTTQDELSVRAASFRASDAARRLYDEESAGRQRRLDRGVPAGEPVWWGADTAWRTPHWWHTKFHSVPNPDYNATFAATFKREVVDDSTGDRGYFWDNRAEEFIWVPDETASGACVTSEYWRLTQPGEAFENDASGACESLGASNSYWGGTWYEEGMYSTPTTCSQGRCEVWCNDPSKCANGRAYNATECAALSRCTRSCEACEQSVPINQGEGICYRLLPAVACTAANGEEHDSVSGLCEFTLPEADCLDAGHAYYRCGAENRETCNYWHPYSSTYSSRFRFTKPREALQCSWRWNDCADEAACTSNGECSDWEFASWRDKGNGAYGMVDGACLKTFTNDFSSGQGRSCDWASGWHHHRIGCVKYGLDFGACQAEGGVLKKRAKNANSCADHGKGCKERDWYELTPKSEAECAECGGSYENAYEWYGGVWRSATVTPLYWKERRWGSTNSWVPTLQWNNLERVVRGAAAQAEAESAAAVQRCKHTKLMKRLEVVACACTDTPDASCGNNVTMSTTAIEVLIADVSIPTGDAVVVPAGTAGSIGIPASAFTDADASTIEVALFETDVIQGNVELTPTDVRRRRVLSVVTSDGRARRLSRAARRMSDVEEASVMTVITTGIIIDYGTVVNTTDPVVPEAPVQVCLSLLDTYDEGELNETYPVLDAATWDPETGAFTLLSASMSGENATTQAARIDGDTLCVDTVHVGRLAGVRRIADADVVALAEETIDTCDLDVTAMTNPSFRIAVSGGVVCSTGPIVDGSVPSGAECTFTCAVNTGVNTLLTCLDGSAIQADADAWADANCDVCPAGTWGLGQEPPLAGHVNPPVCQDCGIGHAGPGGTTACTPCPRGQFTSTLQATECENCPAGTHTLGLASICVPCNDGFYASTPGTPECLACGFGSASDSATRCDPCPTGTFSAGPVETECVACGPGSVAAEVGKTSCASCGANTVANATGLAQCFDCGTLPGEWGANEANDLCIDISSVSRTPSVTGTPDPSATATATPSAPPSHSPTHTPSSSPPPPSPSSTTSVTTSVTVSVSASPTIRVTPSTSVAVVVGATAGADAGGDDEDDGGGLGTGAIIGISVGGAALVIIIAVASSAAARKKKKKGFNSAKASGEYDSSPDTDDEDAEEIGLLHQKAGFHRGRRRLADTDSEDE